MFAEFLHMDPETGDVVAMVADDDGFRPATAHEISSEMKRAMPGGVAGDLSRAGSLFRGADAALDEFIAIHSAALETVEIEAWDCPDFLPDAPCA